MKNKKKRKNYFRCQYQKGKTYVAIVIEKETVITAEDMIVALCQLAIKVSTKVSEKTGMKVALQVLKIHERFIKTIKYLKRGTGSSKSFILNVGKKNNVSCERVDLEIYGNYGTLSMSNPNLISKYINLYRKMKGWTD